MGSEDEECEIPNGCDDSHPKWRESAIQSVQSYHFPHAPSLPVCSKDKTRRLRWELWWPREEEVMGVFTEYEKYEKV